MQKQSSTPPGRRKNFRAITIAGLVLLVAGLILVRQLYYGTSENPFYSLLKFSPVMVVLGAAMLLMGLFRLRGSRSVPALGKRRQNFWRILIWLVTLLSVFPWWWLGILTRLQGGRPGNEGEGMIGFMMMLYIGLPMVALAISNEIRIRWKRYKARREKLP